MKRGHATRRRSGSRRISAAALTLGVMLIAAPAALAESATSPTGMLSVAVPAPVLAGAASTYTMTVTNTTAAPLSGLVAQGDMPSGMTLKNVTGCARLGGNQTVSFLCSLPNLAPGASETAGVSVVASTPGSYSIPFSVAGAEPVAGSPGTLQVVGDSVTLPVTVTPGPTDIQVTGSASNGAPPVGSTFNYVFQVKNNGPLPASGVTFDDTLPATVLLGGTVTIDNGTCTANVVSNSVHCDIGNLIVGQQSNIAIAAKPTVAGSFGDTAAVAMTGTDTHPANNSVSVTVQPK